MKFFNRLNSVLCVIAALAIGLLHAGAARSEEDTCSAVKMNGSGVWYPVSMREGADGTLRGVFPDFGREILTALNVTVEEGPELPWKRLFVMLENGQIDVLAGAYMTTERQEKFGVSRPVMTEEVGIFVRKSLESRPASLDDLVGLRGLAPFGASFGQDFEDFAAGNLTIDRQPYDDFRTYMRLLMEDKADYLVIARQDGEMMIGEAGAKDLVEALPWAASVNTLHFLFSRASPCLDLLEPFNETLEQRLGDGALQGLIDAYALTAGDG